MKIWGTTLWNTRCGTQPARKGTDPSLRCTTKMPLEPASCSTSPAESPSKSASSGSRSSMRRQAPISESSSSEIKSIWTTIRSPRMRPTTTPADWACSTMKWVRNKILEWTNYLRTWPRSCPRSRPTRRITRRGLRGDNKRHSSQLRPATAADQFTIIISQQIQLKSMTKKF